MNASMMKEPVKTKIAIVGCGPVGMFGALLFQHFGFDFVAVEKYPSARALPNAHWINASTKAIFRQVPGLAEQINQHQEQQKWDLYRSFRYVQTLFGFEMGIIDHFEPDIQQRLKQSQFLFGQKPAHIPQNILLKIMYNLVKTKNNILFGHEIKQIKLHYDPDKKITYYVLLDQNSNQIVHAQNVVLANGASSKLRQYMRALEPSFKMEGKENAMNFINIYFRSPKLAQKINEGSKNAMLHFIYNKKMVGILVNHMVTKQGVFVLQVVNYQPIVDLLKIYTPKQLIKMMFDQSACTFATEIIEDLQVINTNKWQLSALLANKFYSKGLFLVGDCAHSIPPAGGFGMNTGLHDIHDLVHAFLLVTQNPKLDKQKIFNQFSLSRWRIDLSYLNKAIENYKVTKNIAKQLGYPSSVVEIFSANSLIRSVVSTISQKKPQYMQKIRLKTFSYVFKRKSIQKPKLQLFFDELDINAQKISIIKPKILFNSRTKGTKGKQRIYNLYAKQWQVSYQEIRNLYGQVEAQNIKFYNPTQIGYRFGQKLISSNGTIIIK